MSSDQVITRITKKGVIQELISPPGSDFSKFIIEVPVIGDIGGASSINDLDGVDTSGALNGDALIYNALTQLWEPQSISGSVGITGPGSSNVSSVVVWDNTFGTQVTDSTISYISSSFSLNNFSGFASSGVESNISFVILPKGQGSIQANVSDGTALGGNNRGNYSIDFQIDRVLANQVASGDYSSIIGGKSNEASGNYSTIIGGENSEASGNYSAVIGGENSLASGNNSAVIGGEDSAALGDYSIAFGLQSKATKRGEISYSNGMFSSIGDAQGSFNILRCVTEDNTIKNLTLDGLIASIDNKITLDLNSLYTFYIQVIAIQSDGPAGIIGDSRWWHFAGAIRKISSGTSLISNVTKLEDFGTSINTDTWDVIISANDADSSLDILAQGENNKTIRWVANIIMTKAAF